MTNLGRGLIWPSYRDDPGALEPDMTDEQYERLTYQPQPDDDTRPTEAP